LHLTGTPPAGCKDFCQMKRLLSLTAALISLSFVSASLAQEAQGALRQACQQDIQTLCARVEKGGGRLRQCMKANRGKLSAECKQALVAARGKMKARKNDNPLDISPTP
jgi:hypothetical protein